MAAMTMKTKPKAFIYTEWQAQYSPSMSGHCDACGKPNNGRDTHDTHTVRSVVINDTEFQICDRHPNLSSAARKAWKRATGKDCGAVRLAA